MALYVDIHTISGVTTEDAAKAHLADLQTQGRHDVHYLGRRHVWCLYVSC